MLLFVENIRKFCVFNAKKLSEKAFIGFHANAALDTNKELLRCWMMNE